MFSSISPHWLGCWDFCKVLAGVLQPCLHLAAAGRLCELAGMPGFACTNSQHSQRAELLMQITLQLQGLFFNIWPRIEPDGSIGEL
jgi:hypothetical protein